jgi:hypothetical protein
MEDDSPSTSQEIPRHLWNPKVRLFVGSLQSANGPYSKQVNAIKRNIIFRYFHTVRLSLYVTIIS